MKTKKSIIKISLISIILLLFIGICNRSYASIAAIGGVTALATVLIIAIQYFILAIGLVAEAIIVAVGALAPGSGSGTLGNIVFNQCAATTPNFFPEIFDSGLFKDSSAVWSLTQTVGQYYSIIRYLAIAILLIILIYIGIRMAISTVAADEAKYKKMFFHWAISLVLVFMLHYIIIITLYINNVLVAALYNSIGRDIGFWDYAAIAAGGIVPIAGFPNVIVYVSAVVINLIFMFMYVKRIITLAFLIIISPLITVTYSIDKMGDGKSQALNTWLKEFIFTVLIQPFHCIIYIVFVKTAFDLIGSNTINIFSNLGKEFLAIICMTFMLQAEKIVKKIFGIQADSMGDALGAAALTVGLMQGAFKLGKEKKEGASGKKAPDMRDKNVTDTGRRNAQRNANATNDTSSTNADSSTTSDASTSSNTSTSSDASTSSNTSTSSDASTSSNTSTSSSSSTSGDSNSASTPSASTDPINDALKESKFAAWRKKQFKSGDFSKGFFDTAKRWTGEKDINSLGDLPKGLKTAWRGALVGAAAITGGTASGADGALNAGLAAYAATNNMKSKSIGNYNEEQLEINQEVLAGAYEDFADKYREVHGDDVSDLDILAAAKDLYENTGSGAGLDDYELDFYKQMDLMKDTYEALGYDNAWEGIEESIQLIQAKEITPHEGYIHKNYSNSSSGSSNNNQQTQQSTRTSNRYTQQNNPNSSGQMDDISDILDDLNNRRNN